MNIRTKDRVTALVLAVVMSLGATGTARAFEPWSDVNGYWVAGDGLTVIDDAVEKGVTITKYQNKAGDINWKKVFLDDISFAMVRLGYYNDQDPYFDVNMKSAESVGIKTGVCFYGSAVGTEEAREEARYVLDIIKDYRVSYPVGYDLDSAELEDMKLSKKQITDQINAFCEVIEAAGYPVIVFGDYEWLRKSVDIRNMPYDIWYNRAGVIHNFQNRVMWRCTDRGEVQGITGQVCLEFSFDDYSESFPSDGWREINGTEYYFINHRMAKSRTLRIDEGIYVFDEDGKSYARKDYIRGFQ